MTDKFLQVNKDLFKVGLNPLEILIVSQIMEFQRTTDKFYMTDAQLAECFGVSAKTISRALDRLENELHFIVRHTTTIASKRIRTIEVSQEAIEREIVKQTK